MPPVAARQCLDVSPFTGAARAVDYLVELLGKWNESTEVTRGKAPIFTSSKIWLTPGLSGTDP
ncbi:hypothetical protein [Pseudomonas lini]|uniref:hypothetical protein n=1 Tax=Pseudomonas lini TaxID=163011 RepID=UPI00345E2A52